MIEMIAILKMIQPYAVGIIFITVYIAEHIFPQRKELIDYKHDAFNVGIGIANLVVIGTGGYYLQMLLLYLSNQSFGLLYYLPLWTNVVIGFLMLDLIMYWWHRINHLIPFLWRFHKFHHADKKLGTSSSVRFHTVELALSYVFKVPLFILLGISAETVIVYGLVLATVVTLHHSNIQISKSADYFLRLFLVSPRMHRIHHSVIVKESNSNYSSVLPYWDRLFRSYTKEVDKNVEFGVL